MKKSHEQRRLPQSALGQDSTEQLRFQKIGVDLNGDDQKLKDYVKSGGQM